MRERQTEPAAHVDMAFDQVMGELIACFAGDCDTKMKSRSRCRCFAGSRTSSGTFEPGVRVGDISL